MSAESCEHLARFATRHMLFIATRWILPMPSTNDAIHCNRRNGIGGEDGGSGGGDDHYDDKNYELPVRASRRWDPLEEKRLLAWRKENRPWD